MAKAVYSLDEIRTIVSPIAQKHGVDGLYLFGSYARGEATPESDLDFRVDKGRIRTLIALGSLYNELEDNLQKPLDLETTESLAADFLRQIRSEEVMLYGRL